MIVHPEITMTKPLQYTLLHDRHLLIHLISNRHNLGVGVWWRRVHLNVAKLSSLEEFFDSDVQKREVHTSVQKIQN